MQQADQACNSHLDFFQLAQLVEWADRTVDKLPIGKVSAIGREAAKCVEKIFPAPRLFLKHACGMTPLWTFLHFVVASASPSRGRLRNPDHLQTGDAIESRATASTNAIDECSISVCSFYSPDCALVTKLRWGWIAMRCEALRSRAAHTVQCSSGR